MNGQRFITLLLTAVFLEITGRYVPFWDNIISIFIYITNNVNGDGQPSAASLFLLYACKAAWGCILAILCVIVLPVMQLRQKCLLFLAVILSSMVLDDRFYINANYILSPSIIHQHFTGYLPYMAGLSIIQCVLFEMHEKRPRILQSWLFAFLIAWCIILLHPLVMYPSGEPHP